MVTPKLIFLTFIQLDTEIYQINIDMFFIK